MTIHLHLKDIPETSLEADVITPSHFAGMSLSEIASLPLHLGNRTVPLSTFFEVSGTPSELVDSTEIRITGTLSRVKMIGKQMNGGRIFIEGDVGMYLGAEMIAGRIHVKGSVGHWAGAEMCGGNLQIEGDAGDHLCAGYRGSQEGMRGGRVYVAGDVGRGAAAHMRRGFIAIKGNLGENAAAKMLGGTIIVVGDVGPRTGINATRGMMFVLGKMDSILPTYRVTRVAPVEVAMYYLRYLNKIRPDFLQCSVSYEDDWVQLTGDFAEGRPRMLVFARYTANEHLLEVN